jgi:ammonium transporter, Amt family
MTNKISRLDRLTLWGTGLRAGLAALAAAVMFGAGGLAFAQEPTPPATTETPATTEEAAPVEAPAVEEAAPAAEAAAPAAEEAAPFVGEHHQAALELDSAAASWILTSTALVLLMTIPGLALFYGGMVRKKNVLSTVTQSFAITCLVSVIWMVAGYSLAFGVNPDEMLQKYIGSSEAFMLNGVTTETAFASAPGLPEMLWVVYQMTFAIITPALIAGAFAERMKFLPMLIFMGVWSLVVYSPICHWVWGGGFLGGLGVLDFAGGTVVHINAGVAGLMCALVLGKRKGYPTENMAPHNLVYTMIGASLLWVGWFGFNAGSEWAADGIAAAAMLNTQVATAMAALVWMVVEWLHRGKPSMLGLASGAVAGLVAITPACGFVNPVGALIVGAAGGAAGYFGAVFLKKMFGYDDSLDAFGVHGVCGIVGALLTGVLADPKINSLGEGASIVNQAIGIGVTIGYTAVASLIILFILKFTIGLRVKEEAEEEGLDYALHGEAVH